MSDDLRHLKHRSLRPMCISRCAYFFNSALKAKSLVANGPGRNRRFGRRSSIHRRDLKFKICSSAGAPARGCFAPLTKESVTGHGGNVSISLALEHYTGGLTRNRDASAVIIDNIQNDITGVGETVIFIFASQRNSHSGSACRSTHLSGNRTS